MAKFFFLFLAMAPKPGVAVAKKSASRKQKPKASPSLSRPRTRTPKSSPRPTKKLRAGSPASTSGAPSATKTDVAWGKVTLEGVQKIFPGATRNEEFHKAAAASRDGDVPTQEAFDAAAADGEAEVPESAEAAKDLDNPEGCMLPAQPMEEAASLVPSAVVSESLDVVLVGDTGCAQSPAKEAENGLPVQPQLDGTSQEQLLEPKPLEPLNKLEEPLEEADLQKPSASQVPEQCEQHGGNDPEPSTADSARAEKDTDRSQPGCPLADAEEAAAAKDAQEKASASPALGRPAVVQLDEEAHAQTAEAAAEESVEMAGGFVRISAAVSPQSSRLSSRLLAIASLVTRRGSVL